jgi:hypothetical protein
LIERAPEHLHVLDQTMLRIEEQDCEHLHIKASEFRRQILLDDRW